MVGLVRDMAPLVLACALLAGCEPPPNNGATKAPVPATGSAIAATPTELASTKVLFGDLHMHTGWSFDAFIFKTTATPEDAYTFAKGGPLAHPAGGAYQLDRPLDFLAVTDHSEFAGVMPAMADPASPLSKLAFAKNVVSPNPMVNGQAFVIFGNAIRTGNLSLFEGQQAEAYKVVSDTWAKAIEIANRQNDPGKFTALVAYEWTAADTGREIHRNIIFRGSTAPLPFTSMDSNRPEDLWGYLETARSAGQSVLAIPHNPNLSDGGMFATTDSLGKPLTAAYAQTRLRNEPVVEITQTKGTSETHTTLSPNDEFAGFELFDSFPGTGAPITHLAGSYVRDALKTGVALQDGDGFNPYRFGVVGGTDSHLAMSPVMEKNYFGTVGTRDGTAAARLNCTFCSPGSDFRKYSSSGLAALWARENTREAIFDALARKEAYATTGPRMQVRFFGGFGISAVHAGSDGWVEAAYRLGVPMGGSFNRSARIGSTPSFAIWALKDPEGANLDRLQIIKVWSRNGVSHEKIFDVALSDSRVVNVSTGKAPPVGNTVNVAAATYTNTIGAATLSANWSDPAFDPNAQAAYYVRALEIPTPRWSTYDAARLLRPVPADLPATIQERAFTSAIWYNP